MDWEHALNYFGFPILCLVALASALWRIGRFIAKEVVCPLRDVLIKRVVDFVDHLDAALTKWEQHRAVEEEWQERIEGKIDGIGVTCNRIELNQTAQREQTGRAHQPRGPRAEHPPA